MSGEPEPSERLSRKIAEEIIQSQVEDIENLPIWEVTAYRAPGLTEGELEALTDEIDRLIRGAIVTVVFPTL